MRKKISAANTAFRSRRTFKSGFILTDSIGILGVSGGFLLQLFSVNRSEEAGISKLRSKKLNTA